MIKFYFCWLELEEMIVILRLSVTQTAEVSRSLNVEYTSVYSFIPVTTSTGGKMRKREEENIQWKTMKFHLNFI